MSEQPLFIDDEDDNVNWLKPVDAVDNDDEDNE